MQISKLKFQWKIYCFILIIFAMMYKFNTIVVKADAQSETWNIKTALDNFVVKKGAGGQYFINGRKVHLDVFSELTDFVNNKLAFADEDIGDKEDTCSKPDKTPDLQVLMRKGNRDKKILVYIDERLLIVNHRCSSIEGEGIFALPMHRAWYIGPKTAQINIETQRRLVFNGSKSIVYKEKTEARGRAMKLLVSGIMPDWSKIDLFEKKIRSIEISGRRHLSYAKDSSNFTFITNNREYTFYEIRSPQLIWALKLPDKPFLILSNSFSWHEFNLEYVADLKGNIIDILRDSKASEDKRIRALKTLRNYWNPSFQEVLFGIFRNEDESTPLRKEIAEFLIQKPTSLNKRTLLDTLLKTEDPSLREYISMRLRIFYPKGKAISANDDDYIVTEKMNIWRGL